MVSMVVVGLVAMDFAMMECSCVLSVIKELIGTLLPTYKISGTELCRV